MKSFIQVCALLILVSCQHGNVPQMERKIKIWNGAPEENGICRMTTDDLADKLNTVNYILKGVHKGTRNYECIDARDEKFKEYASLTFDDLGVMYNYIQTLIFSCKEWKQ